MELLKYVPPSLTHPLLKQYRIRGEYDSEDVPVKLLSFLVSTGNVNSQAGKDVEKNHYHCRVERSGQNNIRQRLFATGGTDPVFYQCRPDCRRSGKFQQKVSSSSGFMGALRWYLYSSKTH